MSEDEKWYNEMVEGYKDMPNHDEEAREKLQAHIDGLVEAERTKYETFFKLLPIHMKIVEQGMNMKLKYLHDCECDLEKRNERLSDIVTFLFNKLHDIQIESIRHGILKEADFK